MKKSWGYQTQLALLVGVVAAILILIVAVVTREDGRISPRGTNIGREPFFEPLDNIPPTAVRNKTLPSNLQRPTPKPVVEQSLDIGRTQTIDDVTVELVRAEVTDKGLSIAYSMDPSSPFEFNRDVTVLELGKPNIKFSDGQAILSDGYSLGGDFEAITFGEETRMPVSGESVTVSMGSYIISAPELTGSVTIPLNAEYDELDFGQEVAAETYLKVDGAQFRVSVVKLDKFTRRIIVIPVNDLAQRIVLIFGGDRLQGASLTYGSNGSLGLSDRRTHYGDDFDSPLVESIEIDFNGLASPTTTSLTFSIQGGGRIRGPFMFEDVRFVTK